MQSGGSQQGVGGSGGGGHGGRNSSASSAASPSSSSSAVSAPHQQGGGGGGFDSSQQHQQQHHQQQQQLFRQPLQQQQLRKTEGDESFLAYQGRNLHGVMGGSNTPSSSGSMHSPQQLSQQQVAVHIREDSQNKVQGVEQRQHQQMPNAAQQAYMQYAFQAGQQKSGLGNLLQAQQAQAQAQQQQLQQHQQQQGKMGMLGPSMGKEQDVRAYNQRMQELMSLQAANQSQGSASRKPGEQFVHGEKQIEQQTVSEQRNDSKPPSQVAGIGQLIPSNMMGPVQASQAQTSIQNIMGNKYAMSQLKAMHAWALESNIDLSRPENCHLIPQLLPIWQARNTASQKSNEDIAAAQTSRPGLKQQNMLSPTVGSDSSAQTSRLPFKQPNLPSPTVGSDSSAHGNSSSDVAGQSGSAKVRSLVPGSSATTSSPAVGNPNNIQMQQHAIQSRENQASKQPNMNVMPPMYPPQSSVNTSHGIDNSAQPKSSPVDMESSQAQHFRQLQQLNRSSPQPSVSSNEGGPTSSGPSTQASQQRLGFTKQQLHVLKAQILAFRRLKRGEGSLPQEVLKSIAPPPLESQLQVHVPPGAINQDRSAGRNVEVSPRQSESNERAPPVPLSNRGSQSVLKVESVTGQEKATTSTVQIQVVAGGMKEPMQIGTVAKEGQDTIFPVKSEQEVERGSPMIAPLKGDLAADRGKAISPPIAVSDAMQVEKPNQAGPISQSKDASVTRKYPGPLFDFPFFTRKHDSVNSLMMGNNGNNLTLAYDVKDLLMEEGMEVLSKKRAENLRKISALLAVNLDRKRISPDLAVRLQIEEKKLRLLDFQARVRDEVDQQQQEIMAMPDRPYRKFVRLCERQRMELARQVQVSQRMMRERQLKSIFQWRKKLLESHWAIRDARTARNRGIAKYHERMLREFSKNKDDDRTKRMEALKNNDVDRYREMLLEQQTSITGDAAERYSVLSSFLSQTEEYLHKLGGKITAAKNHQEVEDAAIAAATAARSQGLSEEEVKAAAACAGEEVLIRKRFSEMNARKESASVNKYYNLAHAVNEKVMRQPSMLRAGTLRDYQLVGLQWMLSLYNNKLNGILADEMGLGKTVQVMALIAYLMEFKGNYGPHLIIVPNAVLVNWKSELHTWLPSVSCIYYVGGKDQRAKLFSQEVCALKFNVLVTTYEFIMYDRTKLSKVDWKYIVIDEAQRMKDRESVLARDLDRYRCQRRLLLTGTPLQNDLKELWSLLNLLLPEVFDNRKVFHDWFSKPFQRDAPVHDAEDDWLETEKKVIIIHRLHQILEPFMLRRRVEDVEGSLPQKVSIVLRCKMSAIQGAIYDWVKATGTIRVDPEDELRRVEKNTNYMAKTYKTLQNRCMELRKTCNHPLLNYPYFNDYSKDFLVRSCGKLWILDRILMKLQRTGHRVLLFSTMTKLLDLLEEYLQWRRLIYRRIDGTTSLDDRESAIVEFNRPDTDCFIFLLSIRAAGRGLNLQTADTVVIYDPDPNPKNEEQAVARAHRIGQKREVKVIYMEAVVDKVTSHQKEDEMRSGGNVDDSEDDLAGKDRYIGSIESLIRNNIQQYKIDMADEVINAGRFDQRTTHEERRMTLETLLHDEERCQETVHNVPSLQEVNRMIARSEEEVELFDQMDEEMDWAEDMTRYDQVPDWLRASSREVNAAVASLSKKPSRNGLASPAVVEPSEVGADGTPIKTERRRGRPKGSGNSQTPIYTEVDDDGEFSEASSEERNDYSLPEVEVEIEECEDEEGSPAIFAPPTNQSVEEGPLDGGYELHRAVQGIRGSHLFEEAGSSGSSSGSRRLVPIVSPSMSAQKFGSLSALESRPGSLSKRLPDELEEGEIAVSGDSQMDLQQSGSWIHDREDGDDEQVLQPKLKRKRTMRTRPRPTLDRLEDRTGSEKSSLLRGGSSQLAYQADYDHDMLSKTDPDLETVGMPAARHGPGNSVAKHKRNMPLRGANSSKSHVVQKPVRSNSAQVSVVNNLDHSRESWDSRVLSPSGSMFGVTKMSDIVQRKCNNVVNKLLKRIDKDGPQIIPLLTDFWKRNETSGYTSGTGGGTILDLRRIDYRVERLEYNGVMDFVSDVQSMLKNVAQYFGFSYEVRSEAKKVQDLFFDIMKIAFPETDLREARNAVMFSAAAVAPKHGPIGQSKRHKLINEVETESVPPLSKLHSRVPASADEEVRVRGPMSKFQKESRLASSSSVRELNQVVESPSFTHPGELVICKKKRNDRDKSVVKSRTAGPVSPPSVGRNVRVGLGPGSNPVPRDAKFSQQSSQQNRWVHQPLAQQTDGGGGGGSGSAGNLGWAKPVKRMRTDTGKRRPSQL